jgi:hypothetical protein
VLAPPDPYQPRVATSTSTKRQATSSDNSTDTSPSVNGTDASVIATTSPPGTEIIPRIKPYHFTVSDIFRSCVRASHVTLIACGSAVSYTPGDEPLGIITSLLCAGASSVLGTLWKVKVGPGMTFSRQFYDMFRAEADASTRTKSEGAGEVDDIAVLVDLAVILQNVVCKIKADLDLEAPYHWAPYILSGSWFVKHRRG